ncbi:uncharacterized protein PODANS_1_23358 [Podospora anserina S mat+]|uniref:Podospora anserina S mat+ genomic DNA chromosome 1, supercontig 6 n=1 Tax=Podospora anserina (strain S / ATCC MYA-4624 / DSM 980 / FGSC 10383) TaxID=515849 RepID=B2ASF8_PODAN|nr:uncharacterized protein PODANS_1_23358 [Podospora anserina S mat+]CAP67331.1 unnamed protein product [Podospora anserina S mat+]CDP24743.1 Putative protein of unknown function [Podospora anserina S mat+]
MPYNLRQNSKPVVNMSPIEVEDNTMTLVEELKTVMDTTTRLYILTPSLSIGILETALSTLASRSKITFPEGPHGKQDELLRALVADMLPATFGKAGREVYDEKYRKALKRRPYPVLDQFLPLPCRHH